MNGWVNEATYEVASTIDNVEYLYTRVYEIVRKYSGVGVARIADEIEELLRDYYDREDFEGVDWHEIALAY